MQDTADDSHLTLLITSLTTSRMEHASALLERISVRSDVLKPLLVLDAPLAPIHPIKDLLAHLTSTPLHSVYFPFLRFGCLHAARAAFGWAAMTKARKETPGVLQDLLGYLTLSCES